MILKEVTCGHLALEPRGARMAIWTLERPELRLTQLTLTDLYETHRVCRALAHSHQAETLRALTLRGPATRPGDAPDDALLDLLASSPLGARLERLDLYACRVTPARLRRLSAEGAFPGLRALHIHAPDPCAGLLGRRARPNDPAQHELADGDGAPALQARVQARLHDVRDHAQRTLRAGTPSMALSDTGGGVIMWRAQVGETVTTGQTVCALEGDKAEVELVSPWTGVLVRRAPDGDGELEAAEAVCVVAALLPGASLDPGDADAPNAEHGADRALADDAAADPLDAPLPPGAPVGTAPAPHAHALNWAPLRALAAQPPTRDRWDALVARLLLLARLDLLQTERFVADTLLDRVAHWPLGFRRDPPALVALRDARPSSPLLHLQHPIRRDSLPPDATLDDLAPPGVVALELSGDALDLPALTALLRDAPPRLRILQLFGAADTAHADALCALIATARGCARLEHLTLTGRRKEGPSQDGLERLLTAPCVPHLVCLSVAPVALDPAWLRAFTRRPALPRLRALALRDPRDASPYRHPLLDAPEYPDALDLDARIQRRLEEVAGRPRARVCFAAEAIFAPFTVEHINVHVGQTLLEGAPLVTFTHNIEHDHVHSPLSGVVVAIHARPGDTLPSGQPAPIVTLAALRPNIRLEQTPSMRNDCDTPFDLLDP